MVFVKAPSLRSFPPSLYYSLDWDLGFLFLFLSRPCSLCVCVCVYLYHLELILRTKSTNIYIHT